MRVHPHPMRDSWQVWDSGMLLLTGAIFMYNYTIDYVLIE